MKITRQDFLKTGATAIALSFGLGETRCSDDEAPSAQSPGGSAGSGGASGGNGGSGGTAGVAGNAGSQGNAGSGAAGGQSGSGGAGSGATGGQEASSDAATGGSDSGATDGSAGTAGRAGSAGDGGTCSNVSVDIETDHAHDLAIPPADIAAGAAKSYTITGDHTHTISLRAIDFERLRAGMLVGTISSEDDDHTHLVEIRCV